MAFDPSDVGVHNGNIFGFPVQEDEAELVIIPVPWDATASYGKGAANGPEIILNASVQLDYYHPLMPEAGKAKIFMHPVSQDWKNINDDLNHKLKDYFDDLEQGVNVSRHQDTIDQTNKAQAHLTQNLEDKCTQLLDQNKLVAVLGGEHSVPLGLMKALYNKYGKFGTLQLDAHADLRIAYEGFEQSHASIMHNALKHDLVDQLTAVGIRDLSLDEHQRTSQENISLFSGWAIHNALSDGKNWSDLCDSIISSLPQFVYISFDIDFLEPNLCPSTGTPVPGGFSFEQAYVLLQKLAQSDKRIIGFDLCEVAGELNSIDANVGARTLFELCICALANKKG